MASYGATNIITGSKIFEPIRSYLLHSGYWLLRKFGEMAICPMCTGFWVGVFWYMALRETVWTSKFDFEWLAFASMASGFSWIIYVIMQKFGESEL